MKNIFIIIMFTFLLTQISYGNDADQMVQQERQKEDALEQQGKAANDTALQNRIQQQQQFAQPLQVEKPASLPQLATPQPTALPNISNPQPNIYQLPNNPKPVNPTVNLPQLKSNEEYFKQHPIAQQTAPNNTNSSPTQLLSNEEFNKQHPITQQTNPNTTNPVPAQLLSNEEVYKQHPITHQNNKSQPSVQPQADLQQMAQKEKQYEQQADTAAKAQQQKLLQEQQGIIQQGDKVTLNASN